MQWDVFNLQKISVMGTIRMTVAAIDWTEGEVGKIHILLSGGHCRIDWGDGNSTPLFTYTRDWVDAITFTRQNARVVGNVLRLQSPS